MDQICRFNIDLDDLSLELEDVEVLVENPNLFNDIDSKHVIMWMIQENILKYFRKSYLKEINDSTHNGIGGSDENPYYFWNQRREGNKPTQIYQNGSLEWFLKNGYYNPDGPHIIWVKDKNILSIIYDKDKYEYVKGIGIHKNSITFDDNSLKIKSIIFDKFLIEYENDVLINSNAEEIENLLKMLIPLKQKEVILSLPAIII